MGEINDGTATVVYSSSAPPRIVLSSPRAGFELWAFSFLRFQLHRKFGLTLREALPFSGYVLSCSFMAKAEGKSQGCCTSSDSLNSYYSSNIQQHARIILNRYTTAFFVFSFIYCFIQGIVQSLLFSTDLEYSTLVSGIASGGDIPFKNTTYLTGTRGHLIVRMCNDIPHGQPIYPCITIFNSTVAQPSSADSSVRRLLSFASLTINLDL